MELRKIEKKGAMELSLSTIVIVVLSLTMLILGFVLIRSIMCSAIGLTEQVNEKIKAELDSFFSSTGEEYACIGQSGSPVTLVPGKNNLIHCGFKASEESRYRVDIKPNYDLSGISRDRLDNWFRSRDFDRRISPGDDSPKKVAELDIGEDAPEKAIILDVDIYRDDNLVGTSQLDFKISQQGAVRGFIC